MLNPKTHFEQVPLETVRKIIEEQAGQETAIVEAQVTQKTISGEEPLAQEQPRAIFHAVSHVEL